MNSELRIAKSEERSKNTEFPIRSSIFALRYSHLSSMLVMLLTPSGVVFAETASEAAQRETPAPGSRFLSLRDFWSRKRLTGELEGTRPAWEDAGLEFRLFYNQQYQQNFRGGLRTHNAHRLSGSFDFQILLDFEKMRLIDNGSFFIEAQSKWSDGINPDKVGALFDVNADVEGDQPILVNKWWYRQTFADEKVDLRFGVLETTKDLFDVSPYAGHEDLNFLNLLSLHNATIPHRIGLGAFVGIHPTDWLYIHAAAIDAQSRVRRTRFDSAFHEEDWFLGFWEVGITPTWKSTKGPMPGNYRIGWWYDPRPKEKFKDTLGGRLRVNRESGDVGVYLGFDQLVWKENADPKDTQGLGVYARYGHAHGDVNQISDYWSAGISWQGLIPERDKDVLGISVAQAILSEQFRNEVRRRGDRETVYEVYYSYFVNEWLIVSPDLQVITNPGGGKDGRDAIVGGIRIRMIF